MAQSDSVKRFVPTRVACLQLGCGKAALYAWGKTGAIGFLTMPNGYRRWAVDDFIARNAVPATANENRPTREARQTRGPSAGKVLVDNHYEERG